MEMICRSPIKKNQHDLLFIYNQLHNLQSKFYSYDKIDNGSRFKRFCLD